MRYRRLVTALCIGLLSATATTAAEPVQPVEQVSGWEAVGRLTMGSHSMCTGALIAPDLVLTAAHCLYDPRTGNPVRPASIRFDAGLSHGQAKASRQVAAAAIHPGYQPQHSRVSQAGVDIAVLTLDSPISPSRIRPFSTEAHPESGDALGVISYTLLQQNSPMLQHPCSVVARRSNTLVTNCEVDFGASGAPVFAIRGGAQPRLVSVISAKAELGKRPVSVGTLLDNTLPDVVNRAR